VVLVISCSLQVMRGLAVVYCVMSIAADSQRARLNHIAHIRHPSGDFNWCHVIHGGSGVR